MYKGDDGRPRERAGRIRLQAIQDAGEENIGTFIQRHIEPGSRIRTDGWRGYSDTALAGYKHSVRIVGIPERGSPAGASHPSRVQQSEDLAVRHASWGQAQVSAALLGRVRLSLHENSHLDAPPRKGGDEKCVLPEAARIR